MAAVKWVGEVPGIVDKALRRVDVGVEEESGAVNLPCKCIREWVVFYQRCGVNRIEGHDFDNGISASIRGAEMAPRADSNSY